MEFRVIIVFAIVLSLLVGVTGEAPAQSSSSDAATSVNLRIDASAAVMFADLMSYIRAENDDFFASGYDIIPAEMAADRVEQNRQNPKLSEMIDSLLALPVYAELSRIMRSFEPEKLEGRAAYREAFYRLPWMRTRLMGGVDGQYLQLLHEFDLATEEWVADLAGKLKTEEFATGVVDVYLYFDGNRGCFRRGGSIYVDLMQFALVESVSDSVCVAMIVCTVAHELHHVIYGDWLAESTKAADADSDKSWRAKALKQWRDAVLMEGTARFCDWENLPECAQGRTCRNAPRVWLSIRDWGRRSLPPGNQSSSGLAMEKFAKVNTCP